MIQDFVWTVTTILMALAAGIFAWVATAAEKAPEEYAFPVAAFYRLRPWLFVIAIVVLVAANYKALSALPYVSQPGVGPVQRVGTTMATGFAPLASPTARTDFGRSGSRAYAPERY